MWVVGEKRREVQGSLRGAVGRCAEESKGKRRRREDKVGFFFVSTVIFFT